MANRTTPETLPPLLARLPVGAALSTDEILDRFLDYVLEEGLEPYPAQEEAFLELMSGRHVILATPTGSGKSMVALLLHFKAMCERLRSFYTAPTKALVNEKFFALCDAFGAEQVGMLTGDASINPDAEIICCTQEVLASIAIRQGRASAPPYVVMDEFHYYADRDRGAAWQVPLLTLPDTTFLLMSATLGDVRRIAERIRARTGREVALVESDERPVPLDFTYLETPIQESVESLLAAGKGPIYIVHFTQRECAEQAQGLTSANITDRDEKKQIARALESYRFDTTYGREFQRFLRFGVGVHHAGLLPRYRLIVERLAQAGLLKVICGTDTLGVGVNIPIRTVLFSRLAKFDGEKVGILKVREFKQIAGRAGRKGFDEQGSVACQAPEHVVEIRRMEAKAAGGKKRPRRKKPPPGSVVWSRQTFESLIARPPEPLEPRFEVDHEMLLGTMQREGAIEERGSGYAALIDLIDDSHIDARGKRRQRRHAAVLFRSLRRAGILELRRAPGASSSRVHVNTDLQLDFSLHHNLSLYLVDAVAALDPEQPSYALEVLSLVEAILENPRPILLKQVDRAKGDLVARLKAEGVPYEDRMRELEKVTWPQPEAEFIHETFELFANTHPWLREESIHPKSVAREMYEDYASFDAYVQHYGLARSEGVLLRYLSQVHNALAHNVPEAARTEAVDDVIAFLHTTIQKVDSSLLEAWERLLEPEARAAPAEAAREERPFDLAAHPRAFASRIRAELHQLVRALAAREYEEASRCVADVPGDAWPPARFEAALAPFHEEYGDIVFTPRARQSHLTGIQSRGERTWDVSQVLVDSEGDDLWAIRARVEPGPPPVPEGPILRLVEVGP